VAFLQVGREGAPDSSRGRARSPRPSVLRPPSSAATRPYLLSPISYLLSPGAKRPSPTRHQPLATRYGGFAAFTLIELLVVVTVIGILAGLALAAMGGIQKRGAKARAESDIQAISAAIEEFHRDFGKYPAANSNDLFKELTGSNASINSIPGKIKVYFEPPPGIIGTNAGQNFFQDPWGTGYFFITTGANLRNRGLFDIYSTAGSSDQNKWIRN